MVAFAEAADVKTSLHAAASAPSEIFSNSEFKSYEVAISFDGVLL